MQKTYTVDFLTKKRVKNNGQTMEDNDKQLSELQAELLKPTMRKLATKFTNLAIKKQKLQLESARRDGVVNIGSVVNSR